MPEFTRKQRVQLEAKTEELEKIYRRRHYNIEAVQHYLAAHDGLGIALIIECTDCHVKHMRQYQGWDNFYYGFVWNQMATGKFPHTMNCTRNPVHTDILISDGNCISCGLLRQGYSPDCPEPDVHMPCIPDERTREDILYFKKARLARLQIYLTNRYETLSEWVEQISREEITDDALELSHTYMFTLPVPLKKTHVSSFATDEVLPMIRCKGCKEMVKSIDYASHIESEREIQRARILAILRGEAIINPPRLYSS